MRDDPAGRASLRYLAQDALTGYGEAADRLVRALRRSGQGVEYRAWFGGSGDVSAGSRRHSRDPSPNDLAAPDAPTIAHLVPEHYPAVRAEFARGPLISHTVWETDRLPPHWPALLNDVELVVVPTAWNRAVFEASGVTTRIAVVPHVACDPLPGDHGDPLGLPPDVVVFYAVSRWDQRKDPASVVRAFLEAFTADDPVVLVLKTSPNAQYPAPGPWGQASTLAGTTMLEVARIVRAYPRPAAVQVEVDPWTPDRIAGLHARGDCYVSLSHGEGWDIAAFDAAAYGNPVIATGWGGSLTYLDPDAAFLVEYDLEPVQHFEPESYAPDQHWAAPRFGHAVERLREVAHDLAAARRRAAPLRPTVLHEYAGERVVAALHDAVPQLAAPAPAPARQSGRRRLIPPVAHFVFGLRPEPEHFHLVHYLAVASCLEVVRPNEVHLHCQHLPYGHYWDLIRPAVQVHRVEPVPALQEFRYDDPLVARYAYAHQADFVRLDVLAEYGGVYADLDTLFLAPIPDELWRAPFVIGTEADVPDPGTGRLRPALSNALLMSSPGSRFLEAWRAEIGTTFDGSWAAHSCFLAHDLAARLPGEVRVEPQRTFHAFEPTASGVARLLERDEDDLDGVVSIHLAAHLWWEEDRRDFSGVHAGAIDEAWIRGADVTYARAARRFLPD